MGLVYNFADISQILVIPERGSLLGHKTGNLSTADKRACR